jgi:hypothetical protein
MPHPSVRRDIAIATIDFGIIIMGGFGSGNWHRQRFHDTVNGLPEFRAIDFKKTSGEVSPAPRDEYGGSANNFRYLRSGKDVLLFRSDGRYSESSETNELLLKLDSTPCHFGGARCWLLCPMPNCGRRVQSLFINQRHCIGCRQCLGLLYESQYGGNMERKMSRIRTMHRKILRGGPSYLMAVQHRQYLYKSLIDDLRKIDRAES